MNGTIQPIRNAIIECGKTFDPEFTLDDEQRNLIYRKVFHAIRRSEVAGPVVGINPKKGLLVQGSKGVGKTLMMRTMQRLFKDTPRRFRWTSAMEIIDLLRQEGLSELEVEEMYGKSLSMDLYIDDIGLESTSFNKWGNYVNIIGEIIYERNELFTLTQGEYRTHYSTNLLVDSKDATVRTLQSIYGDRITDRLKPTTNLILWVGESLRK